MDPELFVSLVVGGLMFLGLAGSLAGAARRGAAHQDVLTEHWAQCAEALGGALEQEGHGTLSPRRLTITVDRDGALVRIDANVPADPELAGHTRARAMYAVGRGPAFRLQRRGSYTPLDRALGVGDIRLGDEAFDRQALLVADDPEGAAALFDEAQRGRFMAFARLAVFRSDGALVDLTWDGVEQRLDILGKAVDMVATLALHGVAPLVRLAELPGAQFEAPSGQGPERTLPRVRVRRADADVVFAPDPSEEPLAYVCVARPRRPLPEFAVQVEAGGAVAGELPEGIVDPEVAGALGRLGPAWIRGGAERVEIVFDDDPSLEQGEAAVELLARVSAGGGSQGVFR